MPYSELGSGWGSLRRGMEKANRTATPMETAATKTRPGPAIPAWSKSSATLNFGVIKCDLWRVKKAVREGHVDGLAKVVQLGRTNTRRETLVDQEAHVLHPQKPKPKWSQGCFAEVCNVLSCGDGRSHNLAIAKKYLKHWETQQATVHVAPQDRQYIKR